MRGASTSGWPVVGSDRPDSAGWLRFDPYLLMVGLFGALAGLAALDTALVSLGLQPFFGGLRWLRVHLITLGVLVEALFGGLPLLVALRAGRPRPPADPATWLALNLGLLILLVGIPLIHGSLILAGGTLVGLAAVLLARQLGRPAGPAPDASSVGVEPRGRRFYLAGVGFLLVGIVVGSGLWLGWSGPLGIAVPLETHIHANMFGFAALSLAGLLIDLAPALSGQPLLSSRSADWIFHLMTLGALTLVLGPWLGFNPLMVLGALLHLGATAWLALSLPRRLAGSGRGWGPGPLHLLAGYAWFLVPIVLAPPIVMGLVGAASDIEQSAPEGLVYGWLLQVGFALLPALLDRLAHPERPARLGGSWLSLATVNLGAVALWAGLLVEASQAWLFGLAYLLWAVALGAVLLASWRRSWPAPVGAR